MSIRKRKRTKFIGELQDIELNIMPFVDVFSLLISFLLVAAVFLAIGIHEVQIPFFTNAPVKKEEAREISINVDVAKDKIEITTRWSPAPVNEQKFGPYALSESGLNEFHNKLATLRKTHKDTDLVTLFSEDDVSYQQMTSVLDAIKVLQPGDPAIPVIDKKANQVIPATELYPKVVMGSVIL